MTAWNASTVEPPRRYRQEDGPDEADDMHRRLGMPRIFSHTDMFVAMLAFIIVCAFLCWLLIKLYFLIRERLILTNRRLAESEPGSRYRRHVLEQALEGTRPPGRYSVFRRYGRMPLLPGLACTRHWGFWDSDDRLKEQGVEAGIQPPPPNYSIVTARKFPGTSVKADVSKGDVPVSTSADQLPPTYDEALELAKAIAESTAMKVEHERRLDHGINNEANN